MYRDLSKKDKKLARQLINKGLLAEFEHGLKRFDAILQEWKAGKAGPRETYHKIFTDIVIKEFSERYAHAMK